MRKTIILLALLAASTLAAQETINQDVSIEAVKTAKVGDVLLRRGAVETVKADSLGRLSTKVFSAPQWDMTGQPLIRYDEATGRIYAKSRYVQFIPGEATRELIVKREIGNAGVNEFYTVPDGKN